jgi:FKBP-type peptidyl-prolyl cis-trans isomerase
MMMSMTLGHIRSLVLILAAAVAVTTCGSSSPTSPGVDVPYSQTDLRTGTGAEATNGKRLTVNYTLWLYDSTKPDQKGAQMQTTVGGNPYSFQLGHADVIKGWDQGVVGMRVGGLRRLVLPPSLAYGASGNGSIPGNATLVFEIELLDVQ